MRLEADIFESRRLIKVYFYDFILHGLRKFVLELLKILEKL